MSVAAATASKPFETYEESKTPEELEHTVIVNEDDPDLVPFKALKHKISYETLNAITVKPFKLETMTPVQSAVLGLLPELVRPHDHVNEGNTKLPARDILVKARTGTGKTLAFLVPAIEARVKAIERAGRDAVAQTGKTVDRSLEGRAKRVFAKTHVGTLIISPTRELATQIANEALRLAHHHDDLEVRLFTGGVSKRAQLRDWMRGRRDIVVATPGRLLDLLASEPDVRAGLAKTQMLILDEADTLLDMGFRDDIDNIIKYLPQSPVRQTFMFSATVSEAIRQVAKRTLAREHEFINTVGADELPVHQAIPQYHTVLPDASHQIPYVLRLIAHDQLTNPSKSKIVLFLPTTKMTQLFATVVRELGKTCLPSLKNTRVYEIHSKKAQDSRMNTSNSFRADKSGASILVTSDVSARGVDYPGVTRVIQVGIPGGTDQYVHRVGRTGRAGTSGRGDLVLLPWEIGFVTWKLNDMPLKPLTVTELKTQLEAVATKYDENPKGRFFSNSTLKAIEYIDRDVKSLLPNLDEMAVRETFASLLGYYITKSPELRVQKGVIVEGCRNWTVEACGLPKAPFVSDAFLSRLGYNDNRTKHFRGDFQRDSPSKGAGPHWMGRGAQKSRFAEKTPAWMTTQGELHPDDPTSRPEEYISKRYDVNSSSENFGQRGDDSTGFGSPVNLGAREGFSRPKRDFGGDRRDFGGDRREFGGQRREFGGEKRQFGGERREFGGERRQFGGERREFGGERRQFGGERREFGGQRREFGGEKREFGGQRRDFGGDRRDGGERRAFTPRR
ncbi:hypothetical protein M422DRAFT_178309 [Sphaerobolus stellatus SS14]|uniref:ATP-dependent RNA helicase n=1 Tax=Sphaerobolus stellatus (strain SS14) TaxID=990650 RepID=A0A0C9VIX0_SPHS4|nr:hypothetical protein M422DRAFT_178309 [Sphaerobolus stellatus SS14]